MLIGIGGFVGAVLRFVLTGWFQNSILEFPLGTLATNVSGGFLLGLLMYLATVGDEV